MVDHATFGGFVLGLEGLAILRAWMSDPVTVRTRTGKIVEMASQIEEAPWTNPMATSERTVTAGYAEWATTYDNASNPIFLAEEPVVHGLLTSYPVGAALDAACGTGRHAAYLASLGHRVTGIDSTAERLPELGRAIASRSGNPSAQLDSFIVSATSYEDLWRRYDDGNWTRDDFGAKHILFQEPGQTPDYIKQILKG